MTPGSPPTRRSAAHASGRRREHLHGRQLAQVAVLALASLLTVLFWPSAASRSVAEVASVRLPAVVGPPDGPIEIVSVSAPAVWSDVKPPTVTATLRNTGRAAVDAQAWWLLAAPDEQSPWERPAGRGETVALSLEPGGVTRLAVPAAEPPPAGTWRLSVWVHTVEPGAADVASGDAASGSVHSHGSGTAPDISVLATGAGVRRLAPPGEDAALTGIEPAGRLSPAARAGGHDAVVSARSTSAQPVYVEVQCYLAVPGTAEPWRDGQTVPSATVTATLEASSRDLGCRFPDLPRDGTWELSAFVRLTGQDDARGHQDGLYLRQLVTLGGPAGLLPGRADRRPAAEPLSRHDSSTGRAESER